VWVLANSLYAYMEGGTSHNSFEREAVGHWALVHDADEIWTGDLPSPIKAILEEISPGVTKKLKERVLGEHLPSVMATMRGLQGTQAAAVVKVAECVEAITYYRRYAVPGPQVSQVHEHLQRAGDDALEHLKKTYVGWEAADQWVKYMLLRGSL
jgi:5'-deoxynucleotidase YfbR-like HD superfamily hydrolase